MNGRPIPDVLYHYTTQEALLGILNSRVLFATKIRHFDDANELIGPLRIVLDILAQKLKEPELIDGHRETLQDTQWAIEQSLNVNIPVVSFTAQADSVYFWREHADGGCGYAMGFDLKKLRQAAYPFVLRQCEYADAEGMRERMRRLIDIEFEGASSQERQPLWFRLMKMVMTMKDERFAIEDEWRLVPYSSHWRDLLDCNCTYLTCNVRLGKRGLVSYWRLPIDLPTITQIVVGPKLVPELAMHEVRELIQRSRISEDIRVTISESCLS
jgi:hypothetical protein